MTVHRLQAAAALGLLAWALSACSPALNWRAVRLNGLQTLLPCKPDHAQRTIPLGAQEYSMEMVGCEASGALFAVSHVRAADSAQTAATQAAWRQAMLANLRDVTLRSQPFQPAGPRAAGILPGQTPTAAASNAEPQILTVEGKAADGRVLQARWLWLTRGADIYYVAVYGPVLSPEMLDMLFSNVAMP